MGLADLLAKLEREAETPDTPAYTGGVSAEALLLLGCTPETPETPQNSNVGADAQADGLTKGRRAGDTDDRRRCDQCGNLQGGACIIAKPGGVVSAIVGYRPVPGIVQRCAGYQVKVILENSRQWADSVAG